MRKLLSLLAILSFGACVSVSGPLDCGSNLSCLAEAAETCTPAFADLRVEEEVGYLDIYLEINGMRNGSCVQLIRYVDFNVSDPRAAELLDPIKGEYVECSFSHGDGFVNSTNEINFDSAIERGVECKGPLLERFNNTTYQDKEEQVEETQETTDTSESASAGQEVAIGIPIEGKPSKGYPKIEWDEVCDYEEGTGVVLNESLGEWTYCKNGTQFRNVTTPGKQTVLESRNCTDISVDDILPQVNEMPPEYVMVVEGFGSGKINPASVCGELDGVNYSYAELGFEESREVRFEYFGGPAGLESKVIWITATIYSDEGAEKRFRIQKAENARLVAENPNYSQVSASKVGENSSIVKIEILEKTDEFDIKFVLYNYFFHQDRYWVSLGLKGWYAEVNPQMLTGLAESISDRITCLSAKEQS